MRTVKSPAAVTRQGGGENANGRVLDRLEGVVERADDVVDVLDAYGEAD